MPIAPVMIYGDDVSHVVTEEGIAYLHKARRHRGAARRDRGRGGRHADRPACANRRRPPNCGSAASWLTPRISASGAAQAKRSLLAARSIDDLVTWSGGLYTPPARFRSW